MACGAKASSWAIGHTFVVMNAVTAASAQVVSGLVISHTWYSRPCQLKVIAMDPGASQEVAKQPVGSIS